MKVTTLVGAALLALTSQAASAATVSFDDFATTTSTNYTTPAASVQVDDDADGFLTFSISSSGVSGLLRGVFFNVGGISVSLDDILNPSAVIRGFANNSGDVGGGIGLGGKYTDGSSNPIFDFGLRISGTDVSTNAFSFQISDALLGLDDVTGVGLRFALVDRENPRSAKLISVSDEQPAPIPLPAGGALLLTALAGLALAKRRNDNV